MCSHCHNTVPGGCVHCRDEKLETARRIRQQRRRLTDDQRRTYGLIWGRLFTPPGNGLVRTAAQAPPTRHPARKITVAQFGSPVLPTTFAL